MHPVVIVMVKAPRPGLAKTRLTPQLSKQDASSLALCFVQDVINTALGVVPDVIVAFKPHDGRALLETFLPNGLLWLEQRGEDLGQCLNAVTVDADNLGFSPIIITGADSPTLPETFLEAARDELATGNTDVALGPTADGGYYLAGLRKPVPYLFENISWSTRFTFEQTVRNINKLGLRLLTLTPWYDVDSFPDLLRLRDELSFDEKARTRAPATYRWLRAYDKLRLPTG